MQRIPGKTGTLGLDAGYSGKIGHTAEEFKSEKSEALSAAIAPLPSKALQDLIGATRASDQARLDVPRDANPFNGSPNLQNQDYMALKKVIKNSDSKISIEILELLHSGVPTLSDDSLAFMKASIGRERKMLFLLREFTESMGRIHLRIVGSQEG